MAPLTQAERAKRCREKKKQQDPVSYRELEKQRKRKLRLELRKNKSKWKEYLENDRKRKQKPKSPPSTPTVSDPDSVSPGFSCKQAYGRSVKRAGKSLPKQPQQKVAVLSKLVQTLSPNSKNNLFLNLRKRPSLKEVTGRPQAFTKNQEEWILRFLELGNISYTCPGRKDQIYIGKNKDGESIYRGKHYLLWPLIEIIPLINTGISEDDSIENFKVTFGSLWRKLHQSSEFKHIKFQQDIPENTCTCDYCENLDLLITALKRELTKFEFSKKVEVPEDLIKMCICNPLNAKCVDGICNECDDSEFRKLCENIEIETKEIAIYKWISGKKYPEKSELILSGKDLVDEVKKQVLGYKRHFYNNVRQHSELKYLKKNLSINCGIVQVDFAENYTNKQMNATQSSYFGQESFSLYTACLWYRQNTDPASDLVCDNYCFITSAENHSKTVAFNFNNLLIHILIEKMPNLEEVHFWSDGCSAQFRSKFCFRLLCQFPADLRITWNYFESHHGKGPVDGIGGTVKSTVYSDVKVGKIVIHNAEQFAQHANDRVKKICTTYIDSGKIISYDDCLTEVKDVPGTLRVRQVDRIAVRGGFILNFYKNSRFKPNEYGEIPFHTVSYISEDYQESEPGTVSLEPTACNDGDQENEGADAQPISCDTGTANIVQLKVGDYVVAKYAGKKNVKLYLGIVQKIDIVEVEVSFLRKADEKGLSFVLPPKDDTWWIPPEDIISIIPPPTLRRGIYSSEISLPQCT